ncbi:MAG: VIT domain-containing protein [Bacteroidota bacterium]
MRNLFVPIALITLIFAWVSGPVSAQTSSTRAALLIQGNDRSTPLRISDLRVNVKVVGNIAVTTLDLHFQNDLDRVLEGKFVFPLNEGQTVSRFAMEVDGKLREGVVVEKQKGQKVFEAIVRRQVDPGLLEWTQGNNFSARVYPIPARGSKRIVVAYQQELKATPAGPLYLLPLRFADKLDRFDLRVEVFRQEVAPQLRDNELSNVQFNRWEENYVAEIHEENYTANQQLGFVVPEPAQAIPVYLETDAQGQTWFYCRVHPQVKQAPKPQPKHVTLLWDVSGSGANRDRAREIELLDAYFADLQEVEVTLVSFAVTAERPRTAQVHRGKWSALRASLQTLAHDGGTQLGALDLGQYTTDEFLLFSDGINNFGDRKIKLGNAPIYPISSGPDAEYGVLRHLAEVSGGVFINLRTATIAQARELLIRPPFRLQSIERGPGIASMYPDQPTTVGPSVSFAGKLQGNSTKLRLEFGVGQKTTETVEIAIQAEAAGMGAGLLPRIWAQKKLTALQRDVTQNEAAIVALGKEYGLVTRFTSLIVLETLEDYLEFDILPPEDLRETFLARKAEQQKQEQTVVDAHLQEVLTAWEARKTWWKTEFDWEAGQKLLEKNENLIEHEGFGETSEDLFIEEVIVADDESGAWDENESMDDRADGDDLEVAADEMAGEDASASETLAQKKGGKDRGKSRRGRIEIKAWDPAEPYLTAIRAVPASEQYAEYLRQKQEFGTAPSFYLDCANFFLEQEATQIGLRILSNIAEMELENHRLLRILGHRLLQLGYPDWAIPLFVQVRELRPEEPQSYRDLAHAYQRAGRAQEAADTYWEIVTQPWDGRFPEIELIALEELNALLGQSAGKLNTEAMDSRLLENLPLDLRVVLNWDADNCDMDLWVIDPLGEKCYYSHRETAIGGWMSRDFTGGYGPEEFLIRRAMPGVYKVVVNYYSDQQQSLAGATTVQVQMITNFGKKDEVVQEVTRRLKTSKEQLEVGTVKF